MNTPMVPAVVRWSARQVLVEIVRIELPVPTSIRVYQDLGIVALGFERLAPGVAWSRHLGGRTDTRSGADGRVFLDEGVIVWHGWRVQVLANELAPVTVTTGRGDRS